MVPPTKSDQDTESRSIAFEQSFSTSTVNESINTDKGHKTTYSHLSTGRPKSSPDTSGKPVPFRSLYAPDTTKDIDNIRALLEPAKYFQELDDLEAQAIDNSLLSKIFRGPPSATTEVQKSFHDHTCLDWAAADAADPASKSHWRMDSCPCRAELLANRTY